MGGDDFNKFAAKMLLAGILAAGVVLSGCAPKQIQCVYPYAKEAIEVKLNAGSDLNKYSGQSHTVVVMLYQLSDPNIFNQMLETPESLSELLEGKRFDASVLSFRQVVVQPAEKKDIKLDRIEGARYVGVVGGFYNRQAKNFSRLHSIGVKKIKSFYFFEKGCAADNFSIDLELGSDGFIGGAQSGPATSVSQ